ncbi:MAG: relaxase/mobilization nuclease domain-containing protein [Defluviitaleaceae bacterium]|nr:relaxase/mobilization nuclease domain-containing protein [Defluviitaleaceae bacterium]
MAATWIKPIRISAGKTAVQTISDSLNYIMNPSKTRQGELVFGYACEPRTAAEEFLMAKQEYFNFTDKTPRNKDVALYHMRQSFKPGEIMPEEAAKIGYELAMRFTKGRHSFVVATHEDKAHIHCHIMFNSTNIEATRKFKNFWLSSFALRRLSDVICMENGLSIIENPNPSKGHYGEWLQNKKEPSLRGNLEILIDEIIGKKPADFEDFIRLLKEADCEIRRGKHLSIKAKGQKRFIRLRSLSDDYTESAIRERISNKRTVPTKETFIVPKPKKLNLLIDVQNSIKAKNSPSYERWAKIFSLKQAAKTLIFLQDNNLDEYEKLSEAAQKAKTDFNEIQTRIHNADSRLKEISLLQRHICTYARTKDIYTEYKKLKFSKKFKADNEEALADHREARAYFNELNLAKLPTMKMLKQEYATLVAEKKSLYAEYRKAKNFMEEILTAKQNTDMLLNYNEHERTEQYGKNTQEER